MRSRYRSRREKPDGAEYVLQTRIAFFVPDSETKYTQWVDRPDFGVFDRRGEAERTAAQVRVWYGCQFIWHHIEDKEIEVRVVRREKAHGDGG